jgi:beta-mannosidase
MQQTLELREGWELAQSAPGALSRTDRLDELTWTPACVPGTVAGAIDDLSVDPDTFDWWFRTRFDADVCHPGEELVLCLGGIATVAEVFLNGELILASRSMFAAHELDVSALIGRSNELVVCCHALTPELRARTRPRARWRTALVDGGLRFFRTMLLGRAPGFAPGPAVVGPWRGVRLERRGGSVLHEVRLRPRVDSADGALEVRLAGRTLGDAKPPRELTVSLSGPTGAHELTIAPAVSEDRWAADGELIVSSVALWWPHTHGEPTLYEISIAADGVEIHRGRVGFRSLECPLDWEQAGLALRINGVHVFARGAVWTPLDMRAPDQPEPVVRAALSQVVAAGMNMLRIAGIGCYESDVFHDLCDELGILVWQDLMLANLDYPAGDPGWDAEFEAEARQELGRLAGRPSLAVICGGSEVAQQVAMLGLNPELGRGTLYMETIPRLIDEAQAAVPYVPNSPWGGTLPFRPDRGVANYYGVGAYLRDLSDARLAEVKFAAECLAFSNVPDDVSLEQIDAPGGLVPHHPAWKAGVPRDAGAGWDFEDVRDHYLRSFYGEDPVQLRWSDLPRYLALSRAVTGEVMAEVFGEWRRAESSCSGGLVLWLRDLGPGAGWGIIDDSGRPKAAYHHLRRAMAPVAVWLTDEGLKGTHVHLANDGPDSLEATLRITLYRYLQEPVDQASVLVELPPHGSATHSVEDLLGRFVDVNFAYRFGPPGLDVVVASLERGPQPGEGLIANAFSFPVGRPSKRETPARLGIDARMTVGPEEIATLSLKSTRLVHGIRIDGPGLIPDDDAFTLEPGVERAVALRQTYGSGGAGTGVSLSALNMTDRLRVGGR